MEGGSEGGREGEKEGRKGGEEREWKDINIQIDMLFCWHALTLPPSYSFSHKQTHALLSHYLMFSRTYIHTLTCPRIPRFLLHTHTATPSSPTISCFLLHTHTAAGMYCTAGKDRTGIITMLTLHVLGATDEEVHMFTLSFPLSHPLSLISSLSFPLSHSRSPPLLHTLNHSLTHLLAHPSLTRSHMRSLTHSLMPPNTLCHSPLTSPTKLICPPVCQRGGTY